MDLLVIGKALYLRGFADGESGKPRRIEQICTVMRLDRYHTTDEEYEKLLLNYEQGYVDAIEWRPVKAQPLAPVDLRQFFQLEEREGVLYGRPIKDGKVVPWPRENP